MNSIKIIGEKIDSVKISIVIPTYRRPNQVMRALRSALRQEFRAVTEVLVIDNNPERGCELERKLLELKESLRPFQYFKNDRNLGMTGNWNRCFELASGNWVIMLHDDDILLDTYSKVIEPHFQSDYDVISVQTKALKDTDLKDEDLVDDSDGIVYPYIYTPFDFLFGYRMGAPVGFAIKKDFFFSINGYDEKYYPSIDYQFAVKAATKGRLIKLRGRELAIYIYGDNETLKLKTLAGFIRVNSSIKRGILSQWSMPDFVLKFFERYFMTYDREYILRAASNFGHSLEEINDLLVEDGMNKKLYLLVSKMYQVYFRFKVLLSRLRLVPMGNLFYRKRSI